MPAREGFVLYALEALCYELVSATLDELLHIERAHYRLLRRADDFETAPEQACRVVASTARFCHNTPT